MLHTMMDIDWEKKRTVALRGVHLVVPPFQRFVASLAGESDAVGSFGNTIPTCCIHVIA